MDDFAMSTRGAATEPGESTTNKRPHVGRRRLLAGAAWSIPAVMATSTTPAHAVSNCEPIRVSYPTGIHSLTLPPDVTSVTFTISGAGGGGAPAARGGSGALIQGTISLASAGAALTLVVGEGGWSGGENRPGGLGYGSGGSAGGVAGSGGGGSAILLNGAPVVVAGGGGGKGMVKSGGDLRQHGVGGDAGLVGGDGQDSVNDGNGLATGFGGLGAVGAAGGAAAPVGTPTGDPGEPGGDQGTGANGGGNGGDGVFAQVLFDAVNYSPATSGGGGGGYAGGGSGSVGRYNLDDGEGSRAAAAGGAGSSYVGGINGMAEVTVDGDVEAVNNGGTTSGVRAGSGSIILSYGCIGGS